MATFLHMLARALPLVAFLAASGTLQTAAQCSACAIALAECGPVCGCVYPVCECCSECAVCVADHGEDWEDCCECFGLCTQGGDSGHAITAVDISTTTSTTATTATTTATATATTTTTAMAKHGLTAKDAPEAKDDPASEEGLTSKEGVVSKSSKAATFSKHASLQNMFTGEDAVTVTTDSGICIHVNNTNSTNGDAPEGGGVYYLCSTMQCIDCSYICASEGFAVYCCTGTPIPAQSVCCCYRVQSVCTNGCDYNTC